MLSAPGAGFLLIVRRGGVLVVGRFFPFALAFTFFLLVLVAVVSRIGGIGSKSSFTFFGVGRGGGGGEQTKFCLRVCYITGC